MKELINKSLFFKKRLKDNELTLTLLLAGACDFV